MDTTLKAVVVTGANGFLGQVLCRNLLGRGIKVYAVVRKETASLSSLEGLSGIELVYCDFQEYHELARKLNGCYIDAVFHMAWAGVNGELKEECDVQLKNISAACDIVYFCKTILCRRIVFPATISEYSIYEMMKTDGTPPVSTLYHSAKLAADFLMRTVAGGLGIDYIRALLPSVYGPYFNPGATIFLHESMAKLLRGEHCSFTSGEQPYDFIYIDDAAEAFALLGEKGKSNRNYYIGNPPRRLKDFLTEMGKIIAPDTVLGFGELPTRGVMLDYSQFYSNAIYQDTGFFPKISFEEGIRRTKEWLENEMEKVR